MDILLCKNVSGSDCGIVYTTVVICLLGICTSKWTKSCAGFVGALFRFLFPFGRDGFVLFVFPFSFILLQNKDMPILKM